MQASSRFAAATATLAAALLAAPAALVAQGSPAVPVCPAVMGEALRAGQPFAAIRYLADDALEGRLAGSPGEACAAEYIAGEFRRLGLAPAGEDGTYFQALDLASVVNPHAAPGRGRNVIARLEGADPALAAEVVVIGAHYDHLGHGGSGSLAPDRAAIHNGADDNASGVGALLSIAERLLQQGSRPARSVVFLAFTGEESGLLGSAYYVQHPSAAPLERTRAMLNLDMVGRLGEQPLVVYGIGTADEWEAMVTEKSAALALPVTLQPDGYGPSDHTSFYARDIPVLHFFTNVHDDYHRPSDTWEKIDRQGVERVAELVAAIAGDVAARPAPLALRRGAGKPPAERQAAAGNGAYLGTIPDYSPADYGVRLSGVRADSPGAAAGFEPGDVIIRFGGKEVADLYVYTDVLREHRPGDRVEIVVLRDGKETTLHAVLGQRGQ
jgi:hypothetical protein